jgi:hypothetical protein
MSRLDGHRMCGNRRAEAVPPNNEMQLTSGVLVGEPRIRAADITISPLAADLSVLRTFL